MRPPVSPTPPAMNAAADQMTSMKATRPASTAKATTASFVTPFTLPGYPEART